METDRLIKFMKWHKKYEKRWPKTEISFLDWLIEELEFLDLVKPPEHANKNNDEY